jgi:tRNA G18 (ribose-2'-O)-methylase SpoU
VIVLEAVTNADNMGGIFRSARAFGFDAVLLGPRCCDPLYRKSVRVSIGCALQVPFAFAARWPSDLAALAEHGFAPIALTPSADARPLDEWCRRARGEKLAIVVGNEGDGLSAEAERACGARVRIPMSGDVDSLNVATAAAIAMYALRRGVTGA